MSIGYFTERPYQDSQSGFFGATGTPSKTWPSATAFMTQNWAQFVQPLPRRKDLRRGDGVRRTHAERAPQHTVLHGRRDERRGLHPSPTNQEDVLGRPYEQQIEDYTIITGTRRW